MHEFSWNQSGKRVLLKVCCTGAIRMSFLSEIIAGTPSRWCQSLLFATDPVALDSTNGSILKGNRSPLIEPTVSRMGLDLPTKIQPEFVDKQDRPVDKYFHVCQPKRVHWSDLLGLET